MSVSKSELQRILIGSMVLVDLGSTQFEFCEIMSIDGSNLETVLIYLDETIEFKSVSRLQLHPIKIVPEILQKSGFTKIDDPEVYQIVLKDMIINCNPETNDFGIMHKIGGLDCYFEKKIHHFHDLQQIILVLTGHFLTFKDQGNQP